MTQCPLAFSDRCAECDWYGNCSPSQAVQMLAVVEDELQELKKMIQDLLDKK
jgi:hypothetical protein